MIRGILVGLALLATAVPACASPETIVAGLSQSQVSITADFVGSEILIYGAVKRDRPPPDDIPLEVIVTVEGPPVKMQVRRLDRIWGIWVNDAMVRVDRAPSFYAIATTGALSRILRSTEDLRQRISIPRAIRAVGIAAQAEGSPDFIAALVRLRTADGSYVVREGSVALTQSTLFRTDIALPANLIEGAYRVRIFLMRDGLVVDSIERRINVQKAGLERFFTRLAQDEPLVYGALSLLLAVVAGWGASTIFRIIRP